MRLSPKLHSRKHSLHRLLSTKDTLQTNFNLKLRAASLGVRLTDEETALLQRRAGRLLRGQPTKSNDPTREEFCTSRRRFLKFARAWHDKELEREAMLATIEQPAEVSDLSRNLIPAIGIVGTVSWAVAGTQVAGEAGMHLIGCSLVGCVSALGGGTVNNLLFGDARQGVNWARNPQTTVIVALLASFFTFFTWPFICQMMADKHLQRVHSITAATSWWEWGKRKLGFDEGSAIISKSQFLIACENNEFYEEVRRMMSRKLTKLKITHPSPEQLFNLIDADGNGVLGLQELEQLVQWQYDGSTIRYMLDTVSVGASSVTGTAGAIARGLHPVVCVASSVTLCFGGILRDLLCQREVALGSQSFAACTAAGATVYVGLRELALHGYALPLGPRVLLSSGTTVVLRLFDFYSQGPLLKPMHTSKAK